MATDKHLETEPVCWSESAETQLRQIVADALGVQATDINDETGYGQTTQWDSLAHVRLASGLEEGFSIQLKLDEFAEIITVAAIRQVLIRHGVGPCAKTAESCSCGGD